VRLSAQVNRADRDVAQVVPGIAAIGYDRESPRHAIGRQGVERGDADKAVILGGVAGASPQWIEEHRKPGDEGENDEHRADHRRQGVGDEIAAIVGCLCWLVSGRHIVDVLFRLRHPNASWERQRRGCLGWDRTIWALVYVGVTWMTLLDQLLKLSHCRAHGVKHLGLCRLIVPLDKRPCSGLMSAATEAF